jgi:sulfate permease, SulP family
MACPEGSLPVGFLTGVGIQVALGEVSGMLGLKRGGQETVEKIWNDFQQIEQVNFKALAISFCVLVVIIGSKRLSKRIPGTLIAVIGAIVASWALDLGQQVHVLGADIELLTTAGRQLVAGNQVTRDRAADDAGRQ